MIPPCARPWPRHRNVMGSDLVEGPDGRMRCAWSAGSELYADYHDGEWGRPVRGDTALFERISLEAFQSGLSWITILRKREGFRAAFANFDPVSVAKFDDTDVHRLMNDASIVRNRRKIEATIANAQALLALQRHHGDGALDSLIWRFAHQRQRPESMAEVPSSTPESIALARSLKAAGFGFVGPTTAYAMMQACGMVDDHLVGCHRAKGTGEPTTATPSWQASAVRALDTGDRGLGPSSTSSRHRSHQPPALR